MERPSYRVRLGDEIRMTFPLPVPSELIPEDLPLSIRYEDEDMLVVDKPAGMAVHPSAGHSEHTLVHGLLARYPNLPGIGGERRPGIVHRLDKDTSGLIMVAKTEAAHRSLTRQLASRTVKKGYLALLKGALPQKRGVIDAPIARDPHHRQRMAIVADGRAARTAYLELGRTAAFCFRPRPARDRSYSPNPRSFRIDRRAHRRRCNFYGGSVDFLERQFLHAASCWIPKAKRRPADGRRGSTPSRPQSRTSHARARGRSARPLERANATVIEEAFLHRQLT